MYKLDPDVAEVMGRARDACEANREAASNAYASGNHKRGKDMSAVSKDDKRQLYADAKAGRLGPEWQRLAKRSDVQIGNFLLFYESCDRAPTDAELAKLWP